MTSLLPLRPPFHVCSFLTRHNSIMATQPMGWKSSPVTIPSRDPDHSTVTVPYRGSVRYPLTYRCADVRKDEDPKISSFNFTVSYANSSQFLTLFYFTRMTLCKIVSETKDEQDSHICFSELHQYTFQLLFQ